MDNPLKPCPLCGADGYYSRVNGEQWVYCEGERSCKFRCPEDHWQALPRRSDWNDGREEHQRKRIRNLRVRVEELEKQVATSQALVTDQEEGLRVLDMARENTAKALARAEAEVERLKIFVAEAQVENNELSDALSRLRSPSAEAGELAEPDENGTSIAQEMTTTRQSDVDALVDALRRVEFVYHAPDEIFQGYSECPACNESEPNGHATDCIVGRALSNQAKS